MNGMNMYFSARTQTLAQFKEAYDNGKNPELVLYKKRWQMGLLPSGAVTAGDWGIKLGSPKKGDSPRCGETSRSDKKGSLAKGAGCEQREQTEGLKNQSISYLKSIF